ncbi:MAG: TOBE domain-containing protein, partial [Myxococcota bacterium]
FIEGLPIKPATNVFAGSRYSSMNFFDVRVNGEILEGKGIRCPLPERIKAHLDGAGPELIMGIRPEHMHEAKSDEDAVMTGDVDVLEPLGSEVNALGRVDGQNFTATLDPDTTVKVGGSVKLGIELEHVHVFDKTTTASVRALTTRAAA